MKKYIVLLFLGLAGTLHAQPIMLEVPEVHIYNDFGSKRLNWCAPACAECVLKYNDIKNVGQCDIMNYIRIHFNYYGGPKGWDCCSLDPPNQPHPCDQCVDLGFDNKPVSIRNLIQHFSNGTLYGSIFNGKPVSIDGITFFLTQNHLLIAQWEWIGTDEAHTVVICGIENGNKIYYMDPDKGIITWDYYDQFVSDGDYEWKGTLLCCSSTRDYPCHCYNNQYDPHLGETGIDCGGDCPDCGAPPLNHCYNGIRDADEEGIDCGGADCDTCTLCNNCIKDPGEDAIDCGGSCPPCKYVGNVTDEKIITNTDQLRPEVKAFKKITACCASTVASGQDVSFITKKTGSIVLLPGFKAENGSNFRTQMKDLSADERLCGAICYDYTLPTELTKPPDALKIYNLLYAVEMRYKIYKSSGEYIYSYIISNIESDGDFFLWDCLAGTEYNGSNVPTGRKDYKMIYSIYYCNGAANLNNKEHNFSVYYNYDNKSLTEEPEEPETSPQFFSPNPNNTPLHSATAPLNFVIIPNPNPGAFQLETNFPLSEIAHLKITTPLGEFVYNAQMVVSNAIQLYHSASGMFFVVMVLKDGNVLTQKMMVR